MVCVDDSHLHKMILAKSISLSVGLGSAVNNSSIHSFYRGLAEPQIMLGNGGVIIYDGKSWMYLLISNLIAVKLCEVKEHHRYIYILSKELPCLSVILGVGIRMGNIWISRVWEMKNTSLLLTKPHVPPTMKTYHIIYDEFPVILTEA